jgi:hypothetical protein
MRTLLLILLVSSYGWTQVALKGTVSLKGTVALTAGANTGGVPAGVGWHELASTAQVSICPTFLHADPLCVNGGAFAYASMPMDTTLSRMNLPGGYGHSDGSDPNLYYLDLSTAPAAWHILGTPYVGYTAYDCNNTGDGAIVVSSYPPTGAPGACSSTLPSTGTIPAASHLTNNAIYSPSQHQIFKINQNYLAWGVPPADHSLWEIDPSTGAPTVLCDSCSGVGQPSQSNELVTYENTNDHLIYVFDTVYLYSYDPSSPTTPPVKLNPTGPYSTQNSMSGTIDTVKNYFVLIGPNLGSHFFGYIDLSDPTYALHDMTSTADATCAPAVASAFPGIDWDSRAHEVVMFPGTSTNGNTIYILNTTSWTCTTSAMTGVDTVNAFWDTPIPTSSAGRFKFAPAIDAFAWCGQPGKNCFGLRRR